MHTRTLAKSIPGVGVGGKPVCSLCAPGIESMLPNKDAEPKEPGPCFPSLASWWPSFFKSRALVLCYPLPPQGQRHMGFGSSILSWKTHSPGGCLPRLRVFTCPQASKHWSSSSNGKHQPTFPQGCLPDSSREPTPQSPDCSGKCSSLVEYFPPQEELEGL